LREEEEEEEEGAALHERRKKERKKERRQYVVSCLLLVPFFRTRRFRFTVLNECKNVVGITMAPDRVMVKLAHR
jgi:hypothetical protein